MIWGERRTELGKAKWLRGSNLESLLRQQLIIAVNFLILENQWLGYYHYSFQSGAFLLLLLLAWGPRCFFCFSFWNIKDFNILEDMNHLVIFSPEKLNSLLSQFIHILLDTVPIRHASLKDPFVSSVSIWFNAVNCLCSRKCHVHTVMVKEAWCGSPLCVAFLG